jgi:hypothetical protein
MSWHEPPRPGGDVAAAALGDAAGAEGGVRGLGCAPFLDPRAVSSEQRQGPTWRLAGGAP